MPDISKCKGEDCPIKEKCYRYFSKPDEHWQTYFLNTPFDKKNNSCEHAWIIYKKDDKRPDGMYK